MDEVAYTFKQPPTQVEALMNHHICGARGWSGQSKGPPTGYGEWWMEADNASLTDISLSPSEGGALLIIRRPHRLILIDSNTPTP